MNQQKQVLHPLAKKFDKLGIRQQRHFRKSWLEVTKMSRQNFGKRLQKPKIIDLVLWRYIFSEIMVIDEIYKHEVGQIIDKGITPWNGQYSIQSQLEKS